MREYKNYLKNVCGGFEHMNLKCEGTNLDFSEM